MKGLKAKMDEWAVKAFVYSFLIILLMGILAGSFQLWKLFIHLNCPCK